jgi:hypothetical protein
MRTWHGMTRRITPVPKPQIRNAPDIPMDKSRGFTARFGKDADRSYPLYHFYRLFVIRC